MDRAAPPGGACSRRRLAASVAAIRASTVSLCTSLGGHADSAGRPLRGLVTELRLFAGALYSLETLAAELEARPAGADADEAAAAGADEAASSGDDDDLARLSQCRAFVGAVDAARASLDPVGVGGFKDEARRLCSCITYVLASSQTREDMGLLLSLGDDDDGVASACAAPADGVDASRVCAWLAVLNAPYSNREPRDHYVERLFVQGRRSDQPEYARAAVRWPAHAEQHWPAVRRQAEELFAAPPRSFCFVQWALEYARETWPAVFGLACADPGAAVDLTDSLCDGSASPLHLAAALGLPSLCGSLVAAGADASRAGRLGTPLYCALVGREALVAGDAPASWRDVLRPGPALAGRHGAVGRLLDAGADCGWQYRWPDGPDSCCEASLAGLAFWFACAVGDHGVFERVVSGGAAIDRAFALFLGSDALAETTPTPSKPLLALLFTCAFDATYRCPPGSAFVRPFDVHDEEGRQVWPWNRDDSALDLIEQNMGERMLEFAHGPDGKRRIDELSDEAYRVLFTAAVLSDQEFQVRRLCMDPRFEPAMPVTGLSGPDCGLTVAHLAVRGGRVEIVEMLEEAGADFSARDTHSGRTPLLHVQKSIMLATLVGLGFPTTDTDAQGHNIWHLAVNANDADLLACLGERDPARAENLAAANAAGFTPLELAVASGGALRKAGAESHAGDAEPTAAMLMLRAGAACRRPCPHPLVAWAVDWGSAELVERLVAAGADARATDAAGRSALHHVNLAASPALVALVQGLCSGMPVGAPSGRRVRRAARGDDDDDRMHGEAAGDDDDDDLDDVDDDDLDGYDCAPAAAEDDSSSSSSPPRDGPDDDDDLTPAETLFTNTALIKHAVWLDSKHASCSRPLDPKAFALLLTPAVVAYRDRHGLCAWARFCRHALLRLAAAARARRALAAAQRLAVGCLAARGVPARYEAEARRPAVLCLRGPRGWRPAALPLVAAVLAQFESARAAEFYASDESRELLEVAVGCHREDVACIIRAGRDIVARGEGKGRGG